jgi:signal transduction histidine kinase
MRSRPLIILALAFGALIVLIGLLGFGALRRSRAMHQEMLDRHARFLESEALLRDVPSDLYLTGLLIRDSLLDRSFLMTPYYRKEILEIRASLDERLNAVSRSIEGAELEKVQELREEVVRYWDSIDPILDWTPRQKTALSSTFLLERVVPRRNSVVELASEVQRLNSATLARARQRLRESEDAFSRFVLQVTSLALATGLIVAVVSTRRILTLESQSDLEKRRAESAEAELRLLSLNLVQAQEEERKSLSRELHDVVGQQLTALRMELASLGRERDPNSPRFGPRVEGAKDLVEQTLGTIRDLAMGLRPSMLDDLGLGPALQWEGRDFSRRCGIPVSVQIEGSLDRLPDKHRTCIFRVVQEALTNVARHAQAGNIRIWIHGGEQAVHLTIEDDGIGFNPRQQHRRGLGLLGIEERVRELGGTVEWISQPQKGTTIKLELPAPPAVAEVML